MPMNIRPAEPSDAVAMADLLNAIIARGGTTAHRRSFDEQRMLDHYISPTRGISCVVADNDGDIAGFQSLDWPDPEWPESFRMPSDWGVIATFVSVDHQGEGVGGLLFEKTLANAKSAGVRTIDATIRRVNSGGLAYYSRMGFIDYRSSEERVSKRLEIL